MFRDLRMVVDLIMEIINRNDPKKLFKEMVLNDSQNYKWDIHAATQSMMAIDILSLEEYDNILILNSFCLLKSFGFCKIYASSPISKQGGGDIEQVQYVESWLNNHMALNFPELAVQNAIRNNRPLLDFLQTMVQIINIKKLNGVINPPRCL